jgi:hypothetical protein
MRACATGCATRCDESYRRSTLTANNGFPQCLPGDPEVISNVRDRTTDLKRQTNTALNQLQWILPRSWHSRRHSPRGQTADQSLRQNRTGSSAYLRSRLVSGEELRLVAEELAPAVRELVGAARGGPSVESDRPRTLCVQPGSSTGSTRARRLRAGRNGVGAKGSGPARRRARLPSVLRGALTRGADRSPRLSVIPDFRTREHTGHQRTSANLRRRDRPRLEHFGHSAGERDRSRERRLDRINKGKGCSRCAKSA